MNLQLLTNEQLFQVLQDRSLSLVSRDWRGLETVRFLVDGLFYVRCLYQFSDPSAGELTKHTLTMVLDHTDPVRNNSIQWVERTAKLLDRMCPTVCVDEQAEKPWQRTVRVGWVIPTIAETGLTQYLQRVTAVSLALTNYRDLQSCRELFL